MFLKKRATSPRKSLILILFCATVSAAETPATNTLELFSDQSTLLQGIQPTAYPIKVAQLRPGTLHVRITNIIDEVLPAKLVLRSTERNSIREVALPQGESTFEHAPGIYDVYSYVMEQDVPYLVDIQSVEIRPDSKFLSTKMDRYVKNYEIASRCKPRDLHLDRPARTLTCRNLAGATSDMHRIKLPDGRRKRLTTREAARLQSFPDWFEFSGNQDSRFNQVGNAVPPLFALALAKKIKRYLDKT